MARSRKIRNEEVLDIVADLLARDGPAALTFQAAAAVTGRSAATLVQRFGTKQQLLQAALLRMWDALDALTAAADAAHAETADGAIDLLVALSAQHGAEPEGAAAGLLLLREDFRDPVLRARGAAWGEALGRALGRRLGTERGPSDLGRMMASQWQGAMLWWGFSREGTLDDHLRRELEPWRDAVPNRGGVRQGH